MEQISRIGMDTSKHIFQLHGVNTAEELMGGRHQCRRDDYHARQTLVTRCNRSLAAVMPQQRYDHRHA